MLTTRFIKFFLIILIPCVYAVHASAQTINTDSLLQLVRPANHDSINGNIYYELARNTYASDTKKALEWAKMGGKYFEKINQYELMTKCMNLEAVCLLILDRHEESIKLHYNILKIRESRKDTLGLAETLLNIGNANYRGHDKEQAVKYYLQSLKYARAKNNLRMLGSLHNNIGNYYADRYIDNEEKQYKNTAIKHIKESIYYKEKLSTDKTLNRSYNTLGAIYFKANEQNIAYTCAKKANKLALQNKDDESVGSTYLLLAEIALSKENINEAQKLLDNLHVYISENKAFHILSLFDQRLVQLRQIITNKRSNTAAVLDSNYQNNFNNLLLSRQKVREELNTKYETEKKELENANLILKNSIIEEKAEKNKILSIGVIIIALMLLYLLINLKKKNQELLKSEQSIQEQAQILYEQNILLRQSEAFKTKLFSIVSHDIRSPINSLKLILQMSSDKKLSTEDYVYLMGKLEEELDITSNLLNDLLYWSKAQMQTQSISWGQFNLYEITHKCVHTLSPPIQLKKLEINNSIPPTTIVSGDEMRCEFIIRNVIHNAIKYSNICTSIDIGILDQGNEWDFYIKDHGIGISKEKLDQLFTDINSSQSCIGTNNEQGAGIGLLLCHDFIKSLGWNLHVESELGKGTTFHIYIKKQPAINLIGKGKVKMMDRVA